MKNILFTLSLISIVPLNGMELSKSVSPATPKRQPQAATLSPTTVEQSHKKRTREEQQEEQESFSPFIKTKNFGEELEESSSEQRRQLAAALSEGINFNAAEPSQHNEEALPGTPRPVHNNIILHTDLRNAMIVIERGQLTLDEIKWHTNRLITLATDIEALGNLSDNTWDMWFAVLDTLAEKVCSFASQNPKEATDWILEEFKKERTDTIDKLAGAVQKGITEQQEVLEKLTKKISDAW